MPTTSALSKYEFIVDQLREQALSGYSEGDLFPTEPMLAKQYEVSIGTIRRAIGILEVDGIFVRQQGKGTFVGKVAKKRGAGRMTVFCHYVRDSHVPLGDSGIALAANVAGHFAEDDVRAQMRVVKPGRENWEHFLQSLQDAYSDEELAGVWASGMHEIMVSEVCARLQGDVPVINMCPGSFPVAPYSVGFEMESALRCGTRYLIEKGCQNLALICVAARPHEAPAREEAFVATCAALDAKCQVMALPPVDSGGVALRFEEHGQKSVMELMRRNQLLDGLVCTDDFIGRGVLAGLLRAGIRVPDQVHVCTHTRKGDCFPGVFGLPVACLETDNSEHASVALRMMKQIVSGEAVHEPHRRLPVHVVLPDAGGVAITDDTQIAGRD